MPYKPYKPYKYKAFVSYHQSDRQLAERLVKALLDRGHSCFFAPQSLSPGARWFPTLGKSIQQSEHFILIDSEGSRSSDWVQSELDWFLRDREQGDESPDVRRVVPVLVDVAEPLNKCSQWQWISDIYEDEARVAGQDCAAATIDTVVRKLHEFLQHDRNAVLFEVGLVVMAADQSSLCALKEARGWPEVIEVHREAIENLGIDAELVDGEPRFLRHYGSDPYAWKPIAEGPSIEDMVRDVLLDINSRAVVTDLEGRRPILQLKKIDPRFYQSGHLEKVMSEHLRTVCDGQERLLLVVVDPFSICLREAEEFSRRAMLRMCGEYLSDEQTAVVVAAPQVVDSFEAVVRVIETRASNLWGKYYAKPLDPQRGARLVFNLSHAYEMNHLLSQAFLDGWRKHIGRPPTYPYTRLE